MCSSRRAINLSRKPLSVLDETRAVGEAVVKLHGVMVGFVRQRLHSTLLK
jgi:hypothetical protein